jgi:polyisoprenoid-binding protein YceI
MSRLISLALATLLLSAGIANATPANYTIATKLSRVNFSIDHQGFIQALGVLKINPGMVSFDTEDWSKSMVSVSMSTRTLDMGDTLWNKQIRQDESWMALFKHPAITFKSTRIERKDDANGTLTGDLTIAGVTKPVTMALHVNKIAPNALSKKPSVGFTANGTIKRSEFGLDAYEDLVKDEMPFQVQLEAVVGGE